MLPITCWPTPLTPSERSLPAVRLQKIETTEMKLRLNYTLADAVARADRLFSNTRSQPTATNIGYSTPPASDTPFVALRVSDAATNTMPIGYSSALRSNQTNHSTIAPSTSASPAAISEQPAEADAKPQAQVSFSVSTSRPAPVPTAALATTDMPVEDNSGAVSRGEVSSVGNAPRGWSNLQWVQLDEAWSLTTPSTLLLAHYA